MLILPLAAAAATALAQDFDKRQVLALTEPQRAHVLEEMRALLAGTQQVLSALAGEDMAAVARAARPLGMAMSQKAEDHLKGVLPKDFLQRGMAVHQDFDVLAADADALRDPKHTLRQLSEALGKCNACHAAYQVRLAATSPAAASEPHRH